MPANRWALSMLLCGLAVSSGCGWALRKPYDHDPLIRHEKPVMGLFPANNSASSTPAEPYPPPRPNMPEDPGYIREGSAARAPAIVATSARAIEQSAPAARRITYSSVYGHASDYRWLQGTLDVQRQGLRTLRYAAIDEDDRYGGKVRFEFDARLHAFADGDVLRVEGELIGAAPATASPAADFPIYRVRSVQLIRQ